MPFTAFIHKVKPGFGEPIAALLAGHTPAAAGPLLAAGLFVQDDTVVRAVKHRADLQDVAGHLAHLPEVAAAERRLARYLAAPEEVATPEGLAAFLRNGLMRRVQQRVVSDRSGAPLAALRYPIRPGHEAAIAAAFSAQRPEARPALRDARGNQTGLLHGVAVFVKDGDMVRVVQFDGELDDVAAYMASRASRPEVERRLAPYLAEERSVATTEEFLEQFKRDLMHQVSPRALAG